MSLRHRWLLLTSLSQPRQELAIAIVVLFFNTSIFFFSSRLWKDNVTTYFIGTDLHSMSQTISRTDDTLSFKAPSSIQSISVNLKFRDLHSEVKQASDSSVIFNPIFILPSFYCPSFHLPILHRDSFMTARNSQTKYKMR